MSHSLHAPEGETPEPTPEGEKPKARSFADLIHIAANVAVVLSALIVVPMYLIERRDADELEHKQLAAEMFQRKYDERVMTAFITVTKGFNENNNLFRIFAGNQDAAKPLAAAAILKAAPIDEIKIVVDYYNDLAICVEQGLCDRKMAVSLAGQDLHNFYCKARYVGLPELRKSYDYAEYGARLAKLAGDCDKPAPA